MLLNFLPQIFPNSVSNIFLRGGINLIHFRSAYKGQKHGEKKTKHDGQATICKSLNIKLRRKQTDIKQKPMVLSGTLKR